ncbi:MAG: PKD domain-containing protein [bacterium]
MLFRDVVTKVALGQTDKSGLSFYIKRLGKEQITRRATAVLAIAVAVFQVTTVIAPPKASEASAGSGNDVLYGGFSSKADLVKKYNNNPELRAVYSQMGIGIDQINSSTPGSANSSDNTWSVGRFSHGDPAVNVKFTVPGGHSNFYLRPLSVWGAGKNFPGLHGVRPDGVEFWILNDCGNPVLKIVKQNPAEKPAPSTPVVTSTAPPPPPPPPAVEYICVSLTTTPDPNNKQRTAPLVVNFDTAATAKNTPIESYIFDYGDGAQQTLATKIASHTYSKAGTYTAFVLVKTTNGTTSKESACQAPIVVGSVPPPPPVALYSCDQLLAYPDQKNLKLNPPLKVTFDVKKTVQNTGFISYLFDFGDNTTKETSLIPVDHTYEKTGTYTAKVRIKTRAGTTDFSDACAQKIEVVSPVLSYRKSAVNLTVKDPKGVPTNAAGTQVKSNDEIRYTLTVVNSGTGASSGFKFEESINDILEYATVKDTGGGTLVDRPIPGQASGATEKTLVWSSIDIKAGETVSKTFTVKIKSPIPATPAGKSDKNSYDLQIENVFYGNRVVITLPPPPVKQIETISYSLPQTGAGLANASLALFASGAVFLYLRNRLIRHELTVLAGDKETTA